MLNIPTAGALDFLALGAMVNRIDPGRIPFRKASQCAIHVSGGEFNCAANLSDCFGMNTGIATAMVDYPLGHLIQERVRAMGVEAPIVPGIMPITNYTKLARFSDACGADIPRWIRKQLEAYGDDGESIRAFGEEVVSNLCQRLLDGGAPGLHFYTLNQSAASLRILDNLA